MSKSKDDKDPVREFLIQNLNRRKFLGRSALAAGGLAFGGSFLAACAKKDQAGAAGGDSTMSAGGRAVRVSNWPLYIDPETTADFEKATGIHAEYTEDINDNNEYFAKISEPLSRGQSIDRDIIVLTDWMAGRMISLGYCAPLDNSKYPNRANLEDNLKDVSFDPGRKFSVPWLSGMTGIGYNPKKTGRELTSMNDIFDPRFKGQVTMLTEMRDTIGLLMLAEGKDPANVTTADVQAVAAKIKKYRQNGHIRAFTGNDYAEDLAAGNIAVAIAWSGDIQGLAADNPDLRWIAPKEGAMLYSDNMMIPKTSDRQELAMAWINYVYNPVVSAKIVKAAPYISPTKGTSTELQKIAPELASSPLVNPPADLRARLHIFRALNDTEDQEFNRIFQDAVGA
ncbi:MAG: spermidine/putrescine ABC transporter substrate-binding protein [Gemmatimonadota bacterium]